MVAIPARTKKVLKGVHQAGRIILIGSGTTTLSMARLLPTDLRLAVVTNAIAIAAVLSNHEDIQLHRLDGKIRKAPGLEWGLR